jgi:hypothetical protein
LCIPGKCTRCPLYFIYQSRLKTIIPFSRWPASPSPRGRWRSPELSPHRGHPTLGASTVWNRRVTGKHCTRRTVHALRLSFTWIGGGENCDLWWVVIGFRGLSAGIFISSPTGRNDRPRCPVPCCEASHGAFGAHSGVLSSVADARPRSSKEAPEMSPTPVSHSSGCCRLAEL